MTRQKKGISIKKPIKYIFILIVSLSENHNLLML